MTGVLAKLLDRVPVLCEGGMGTLLMQRGLPAGRPGEVFTLERPEAVEEVHRAYARAGARIHKTNTFNANRFRLNQTGLEDRFEECNRKAVALARRAAAPDGVVAGSIGPTGVFFEPAGELTHETAVAAFAEQAAALVEAGVDCLLVETMYDVREALAALEGCRRAGGCPVVVTMTFMETPTGFRTLMGDDAVESLPGLADHGADAVGSNCTLDSAAMVRLVQAVRSLVRVPLLIQPNAGQPQTHGGSITYPESPAMFAESAVRLAELGVELIGGCCGTTPDHLAAARARLAAR